MLSEQACPIATVLLGFISWNMVKQKTSYTKVVETFEFPGKQTILASKIAEKLTGKGTQRHVGTWCVNVKVQLNSGASS